MPSHSAQTEPRILFTAIQEMDHLARRFRRRLRDVAVELSRQAGHCAPIGPDTIRDAMQFVCQELASDFGVGPAGEGHSDGEGREAA